MKGTLLVIIAFLLVSCNNNSEQAEGSWIKGNKKEQIETIERQFRGFDMAMVETDYRFQELYWAGKDENWDHADYQLKKIRLAIENGLQRRPKRAQSAEHFLSVVLPEMEKVAYFTVKPPLLRQSSIRSQHD